MTGSLKDFSYMDDFNRRWALRLDESNAKGIIRSNISNDSERLFLPAETPFPSRAPQGLIPRTLSCVLLTNPNIKRRFVCGRKGVFLRASIEGGSVESPAGTFWIIIRGHNEGYPLAPQYDVDTGLTDGTPLAERQGSTE
jgi:hypothetical protein